MNQRHTSPSAGTKPSEPPLNAAQRRLHRAALQLFAEHGVTRINASELAEAAGVARGTVYNNLSNLDDLFSQVAAQLSAEMIERIDRRSEDLGDPAEKLGIGIRYFSKGTHDDPHWGRFICRFALSAPSLQHVWTGRLVEILREGRDSGRLVFQPEQLVSVVSLIMGATLGSMLLVLEGRKTWRDAGSDAAQFVLSAIGVPGAEAREIALQELPEFANDGF